MRADVVASTWAGIALCCSTNGDGLTPTRPAGSLRLTANATCEVAAKARRAR